MRNSMFGYSFMFAAAMIGCGGDDDGNATPDAKVFMDAAIDSPPAAMCTVMSQTQALGLGMPTAQAGDFMITPTSGPNMGKNVFLLGAGLPGSTMTLRDVLAIEVVEGTGFLTGNPYMFQANPTVAYTATSYILEDFTGMAYSRYLHASNGSVTFTMIGKQMGNAINGSMTATNFREVNEMTGADVAGGCTVSLAGLSFALTQNMNTTRTEMPSWSADGLVPLTPAEMGAVVDIIGGIKAKQAQN